MPKQNEMDVPRISCLPCTVCISPLTSHTHPPTPSTPLCPAHAPCSIAPRHVPSCPTMSCRILAMSHHVPLRPAVSHRILPRLAMSRRILPCPATSCHVLPHLTMSHYVLLFLVHVTGTFGAHHPPVVAVIPRSRLLVVAAAYGRSLVVGRIRWLARC